MPKREYIGFTRVVDANNRIIIPSEIRDLFGIKPNDELEFKVVQIDRKRKAIEITKKGK